MDNHVVSSLVFTNINKKYINPVYIVPKNLNNNKLICQVNLI